MLQWWWWWWWWEPHTNALEGLGTDPPSFISSASKMAPSRLADKCVDSRRYGGIVRGRVANECERRILFLPLHLSFFFSSSSSFCRPHNFLRVFVFLFCFLPIERSQVASPDAWLSPSRRAADVTAGLLNGQRDKSFIWRSSSPPPPPSSPPPLCFLGRYAESLLAAVCVKGRKGGGEKRRKRRRSTVCVFTSPRLCLSSGSQKKIIFFKEKENLSDFLIDIHKLHWHDVFVGDGDCGSVTTKFPKKPPAHWHKECRYERLQGWEQRTDKVSPLVGDDRRGRPMCPVPRKWSVWGRGGTRKEHAVKRWMTN